MVIDHIQEQVCLHVCSTASGQTRSNWTGEFSTTNRNIKMKFVSATSYSTVHDHELSENFELAGEAGLADSSHVVGLLPHHLLHLHDGGGARQYCGNEGQLEGSCSGKPVMIFTQQQLSVIIFQPLLMQRFVYSPRTLKPSGTPLCSSLTRPQKPCSLTSLQPLFSPQSLTCSSQVP